MQIEVWGKGHAVSNRVLVKFQPSVAVAERGRVQTLTDGSRLQPIGGAGWYILDSRSQRTAGLISLLLSDPAVLHVEPDYVGVVQMPKGSPSQPGARTALPQPYFSGPNDPDYPSQWALNNAGQTVNGIAGTPGADINAETAWHYGVTGNKNVAVAVIDSGIDYNPTDLAANMWSAPSAYTITENGTVYNCPAGSHGFSAAEGAFGCAGQEADTYGHGTAVAGIIGAVGDDANEVTGINWNATLLSLRVVYYDQSNGYWTWTTSDAVMAIDAGMQIANQFYGTNIFAANMSLKSGSDSQALADEMRLSGWFYGIATGNECQASADYPAADYLPNEVAASASDQFDERAVWNSQECSNGGGNLAAPGKNDLSTAMGGGETLFAGTSDAAPHVTGAAALLMSACPLPAVSSRSRWKALAPRFQPSHRYQPMAHD